MTKKRLRGLQCVVVLRSNTEATQAVQDSRCHKKAYMQGENKSNQDSGLVLRVDRGVLRSSDMSTKMWTSCPIPTIPTSRDKGGRRDDFMLQSR